VHIPSISIVVPAYNEERRLFNTLEAITSDFDGCGRSYEVIVVDDGSTDGTVEIARTASDRSSRVRILTPPHRGKGHAVRRGVLAAAGARVVFCDADLPVEAADIRRLADCLVDCDVAIGSREGDGAVRVGEPKYRHVMGRAFNYVVNFIAVGGIRDTQCGLKAFKLKAAREIFARQTIDGFGFDVEILLIARYRGFQIREVPVTWLHRPSSRVEPFWDTLRMLRDVLYIRWNALRGHYHPSLAETPESLASEQPAI
jgi:glycosyltransferase involved in cell wall biosynthesis